MIDNVELDGIDFLDFPDFTDAYITYAERDGIPLTDEELDDLNEDRCYVYELVIAKIY